MIEIENAVFTQVASALRVEYPNINLKSAFDLSPSEFPCVFIEEADNSAYRRTRDTGSNENHALVMYEVNVYSNKASGSKSECKNIFAIVDEVLNGLGFTRTMKSPLPTDDATKHRIVGRYEAVVDRNQTIYRR